MRPATGLMRNESAAAAISYDRDATGFVAAIGGTSAPVAAADRLDRLALATALVVVSIAFCYAAVARAINDHFWMDEVLAVSAAGQETWARVWDAIWSGTDFSPPTYHFFLHGFVKAVGGADGRLVWRLPSIAAVYAAAVCTFLLLLRLHVSRFAAALAFAMVLALSLFDFAIQARQYAFLALGLAAALLLWADLEDTRVGKASACGLWLVLAACLCLHFYGIIEVATIATAELIYAISRRRVRLAVWSVLLLTLPVEAALYPLASHLATFNNGDNLAPEYYAKPTFDALLSAIYQVIDGGAFGKLFFVSAFLAIGAAYALERSAPISQTTGRRGEPSAAGLSKLAIIMIALAVLPLAAFGFSALVTKSFSARYMSAAALLPAIAIATLLNKLAWRRAVAVALVALIAVILVMRSHAPDPVGDALAVLQKTKRAGPVVVGEGLLYIELMQSADADTRSRLVYLKRPPGVASPDPTNENEVVRLARSHPEYRVSSQRAFLADNTHFYVLTRPGISVDTTTPTLAELGILGVPVDAGHDIVLYPSSSAAKTQKDRDRP